MDQQSRGMQARRRKKRRLDRLDPATIEQPAARSDIHDAGQFALRLKSDHSKYAHRSS